MKELERLLDALYDYYLDGNNLELDGEVFTEWDIGEARSKFMEMKSFLSALNENVGN